MVIEGDAIKSASIKGVPIVPVKSCRLAIDGFQNSRSDGCPKITGQLGYFNTGYVDADVAPEYLLKNNIKTANFPLCNAIKRAEALMVAQSVLLGRALNQPVLTPAVRPDR
ncbi:MAG: hypothetical protein H7Z77_04480 [Chitinophagaceae bacterium]|nr:hypothetical protein [Polaromonas sp.]